jgi:hypothetical protein
VPECQLWGVCHCGCGARTSAPKWSHNSHGYVKGMYHRYLWQHFQPANPYDGDRCGVVYSQVAGMVNALFDELGLHEGAKRIGVSWRCLSMWHNGHMAHVQRASAAKIERAYDSLDKNLRRIKLPLAPLRELFALRGLTPGMVWPKGHYFDRLFYNETVGLIAADEMAVSAGMHPWEVWGDWFELEVPVVARKRAPSRKRDCAEAHCFRRPGRTGYCDEHAMEMAS